MISSSGGLPYSTVGQSNDNEDTQGNWIRHNFWANGRHWAFWSTAGSGGNLVYSTSTNGVNWTAATIILGPGINSETYAPIWYNGTNLFYTAWNVNGLCPLVFRVGIPESNGSISWVAQQQTITMSCVIYSDVKTDSNGYVWATFTTTGVKHIYAVRNLNRNGAWVNGTVFQLDQTFFYGWMPPSIVPLANGQVYFLYNSNTCATGGMYGRLWNGTALLPQEAITSQCPSDQGYSSSVGLGGVVYLAFAESDGSVHFNRRLANGSWTSDFLLQNSGNTTQVSLSLNGTSNLIAFWQGGNPIANTVFYKVYTISNNSWSAKTTWFVDLEEFTPVLGVITVYSRPGSFYSDYGNSTVRFIGFQYSTRSQTPYSVKYAFMAFSPGHPVTIFTQIFPSVNVTH